MTGLISNKAIVLVSGGLDSATTLAIAKQEGFECHALSFDYGQRHVFELLSAHKVAKHISVAEHKVVKLDLTQIGGSALTDLSIDVPTQPGTGIPVTYVPARNTIFLSFALGWAEVLGAQDIFIGVNAVDYSLTVSCYNPDDQGNACGKCDSCRIRARGFQDAGVADPTHYQS